MRSCICAVSAFLLAFSALTVRMVKRERLPYSLGYSYYLSHSTVKDCGDGASPTESSCEQRADVLAKGHNQGRKKLVVGSWGHVPFGCSLQTGGDWAAYYNRAPMGVDWRGPAILPSGQNDGSYSLVCSQRNYQMEDALETENGCRPDGFCGNGCYALLSWYQGTFGTTAYEAHWNIEAPQNNLIGQFKSWHDNKFEDRQFSIGYKVLHPGTLLWSKWTGWVNGWDGHAKAECGSFEVLTGIESIHSHGSGTGAREDRLWRIRCTRAAATPGLEGKRWWDKEWQNEFDGEASVGSWSASQLMVGIESYHSNLYEDRRFKFAYQSYMKCPGV